MRARRACETAAARWQARLAKLRTPLTGFDPDLDRLWLAAMRIATNLSGSCCARAAATALTGRQLLR